MSAIKKLIARNFESFTYFYRHLRYRIFLSVGISLLVGVLDGFGLAMFLPLLQMTNEDSAVDSEGMGKMGFLVEMMEGVGISLTLFNVLAIIVIFFLLKGVALFINNVYRVLIQQFFIKKLRLELLQGFNRVNYNYYVNSDVGRIQNTMTGEVSRVARAFQNYFQTVEKAFMVMIYVSFAFFVDARFALLVALGSVLTNLLYQVLYKYTKTASKKFTKDSHSYQGQMIQHVGNFKYLKATGLVQVYADKLRKTIISIEQIRKKIGIIAAFLASAREPLLIIVVAIVIIIQTGLLGAPLGPILISLLFFYRALTALLTMQNFWNKFLEVSGSLSNTQAFQEEIKSNKERPGKVKIDAFKDRIILEDVSFSYGEDVVLKHINLTIDRNETVAFVGESGSGKTTLVNLLAGLMKLKDGRMQVDDINILKLNIQSYQERIGYITQEPVIFNDSIYNNVTFWSERNPENESRFNNALKRASIDEFVTGLDNGPDTILGNNGVNLSGGQKQRISIARELYKDIDILIMDEATSALDSETERAIQTSIDALKGNYTILIVAHRLSTIRNADRIVLLNNGSIESIGNYSELINQNFGFKKMVQLQEL
ncbi:MAG: ABC transporter ATP-binding protein [Bacteroidia bacterium]